MKFLEEGKLISQFQYGFQRGKSTELAAMSLLDQIRTDVDAGQLVGACFIDLSKAFDTISHNKLVSKLESYGIRDEELEWFKNYLFNRHIQVCFDGVLSQQQPVYTGVPQGSILGPLLFVIFFNDIVERLNYSKIIKYADDTVIFCANRDIHTIESWLNSDLDNLSSWFDENELLMNLKPGKTEVLMFGTAQRIAKTNKELDIKFKNQRINVTNTYKYLGIEIDSSLNMNSHFDKTYKKMTGRMKLLIKLRQFLTTEAAINIVNLVILPLFMYCSLLKLTYTQTQISRINSLERRANEIVFRRAQKNVNFNLLNNGKRKVCSFVHDVITKNTCEPFFDYFCVHKTNRNTRNNGHLISLPKIKLEYGRRSIKYMGAKLFNELPIDVRKKCQDENFKNILKSILSNLQCDTEKSPPISFPGFFFWETLYLTLSVIFLCIKVSF